VLRSSVALLMSTLASVPARPAFVLDPFCLRQFDDPNYTGTTIEFEKEAFAAKVNEAFESGAHPLVDGYAPFCKHVFVPNFTPATLNYLEITEQNQSLLRSGYEARTEQELPVLVRWFPSELLSERPPVASFLDVIVYSREQIRKEAKAMGREDDGEEAPWGIISVKAQNVDYELPMQPITMMRNALGANEGGSGVVLKRAEYDASVAFWSKFAPIK